MKRKKIEERSKHQAIYKENEKYFTEREKGEILEQKEEDFFKVLALTQRWTKDKNIILSDYIVNHYKKIAGKNYKKKIKEDLEKIARGEIKIKTT